MTDEANLDAYLRRINYAGSIAPTIETLQAIHRVHVSTIPFENLDPLMERPVRLQLSDIEQKLLLERRGGYCLEHNLLLKAVLQSMDYAVTAVGAGVLWGYPADHQPQQNSHIALLVDVGGVTWLADVGFGGPGMTGPIRLRADDEQETPHGRYRLSGGYPKWRLDSQIAGEWRALYEFTASPLGNDDLVAMNDYAMQRHRDNLMAARIEGAKRHALRNNRLNTHENGETTTRMLTSLIEIRDVLTNVFGIVLPETDRLDPALEKALRPVAG
ncbi:MAG: arylamine N-acetyltransferase [Devosia sp.]|uniref:arylamine N-acetyltransferase family protein n=1 Tax=Devosia sp. TaxID=1871048 RepID=UPI001A46F5C5|nr:arylamine N-acetyltransferase [Devosia sp.]MBL8600113.1 arylamine N-acetyltransferase [Devosia sp.]